MTLPDFDFLMRLADAASTVVLPHFRSALAPENKAGTGYDPVTIADRAAEAAVRSLIADAFPHHGVIGEEYGQDRPDAEHVWVVDPIDGTRAFLAGLPVWGTLIGLMERGRPVIGMMAQPYVGEVFLGDGVRAELRTRDEVRVLKTRPAETIATATLMTTSPRLFTPEERDAYERVAGAVRMERFGGDCYAYCMLAAGCVDLVVEAGLNIYDIAPLIPLIEGAGGVVTAWDGGPAIHGGRVIAASGPHLHEAALRLLKG